LKVREATAGDKAVWDSFVDTEGGNFNQYFDWKYVYMTRGFQFVPLMVENSAHQLVSILPIAKEKKNLYSILNTFGGGLLLKNDLSDAEKSEITSILLKYIDNNYSSGCSRIELNEKLPSDGQSSEEPTPAILENCFRFRYDKLTHLPCQFIIELRQPFKEYIWNCLWSAKLRQELNKVKQSGVVVIQDSEFTYTEEYINMLHENYKRHETKPPSREQIRVELDTFKNKSKLFVALLNERPIVTLLCYYHASTCRLAKIGSHTKNTEDADKLCYATAIEDACNTGYKYADLTVATTPGLAAFKERFKGTRIPYRIYDKRYSFPRYLIEMAPEALRRIRHDKKYFWKNRRKLIERIMHG
jgi:hypothetical protein